MSYVIGFAGFSNSGKTTLIARLAAHFAGQGLQTAVIKHDAHGHYKEAEGTDSALYREAGAAATIVISPESYVMYRREAVELEQMVKLLEAQGYDLILVEGFKASSHDKIALFRTEEQAEILKALSTPPIAVASILSLFKLAPSSIPLFELDDISGIATWIRNRLQKNTV
jgi:molybdopterin-guanine dinucleotide biosynthesis protein B